MAKFSVNESNCLRRLDHNHIDRVIHARRQWGRKLRQGNPGSWANAWEPLVITDEDVDILHQICDFFLGNSGSWRITVGWNMVYFYTNEFDIIEGLYELPFVKKTLCVHAADLKGQPGSIMLSQSDYQFRSFMRFARLNDESAVSLKKFLAAQSDLRLGPSLKHWVLCHGKTLQQYYFIDHNSLSLPMMISLIAPNLIRKTMPIIVDK